MLKNTILHEFSLKVDEFGVNMVSENAQFGHKKPKSVFICKQSKNKTACTVGKVVE